MTEPENANPTPVQNHCYPRMFANVCDNVQQTDDTDGAPVGWTIVAIGRDGSILCQSPTGRRRRYQIECRLDG